MGCACAAPAGLRAAEPASGEVAEVRTSERSAALDASTGAYRTPRAGEALELEIFGRHVSVPERDRSHTNAVNLGSVIVTPNIGGQSVIPFAALYTRHYWEEGASAWEASPRRSIPRRATSTSSWSTRR
jgi:hypothetical protein